MSALAVQSEQSEHAESVFGTKDPILAATLGNFGFQAMHSLPVLLVVSADAVVNLVDKKTGRIEDCAHLEFRFEAIVLDDVFGRITAYDVSAAHQIAKLAQKEQTKELTGSEGLHLSQLRAKWKQRRIGREGQDMASTLLYMVQKCYDQITNFMVICTVTKELSRNPLIEYSQLMHQGVAYAIEPAQSEPVAQRRSEKLFRGERKK